MEHARCKLALLASAGGEIAEVSLVLTGSAMLMWGLKSCFSSSTYNSFLSSDERVEFEEYADDLGVLFANFREDALDCVEAETLLAVESRGYLSGPVSWAVSCHPALQTGIPTLTLQTIVTKPLPDILIIIPAQICKRTEFLRREEARPSQLHEIGADGSDDFEPANDLQVFGRSLLRIEDVDGICFSKRCREVIVDGKSGTALVAHVAR